MKKTSAQIIEFGRQAEDLLSNPIFDEVSRKLKENIVSSIIKNNDSSESEMSRFKLMYNAFELLVAHIKSIERNGKIEEAKINKGNFTDFLHNGVKNIVDKFK